MRGPRRSEGPRGLEDVLAIEQHNASGRVSYWHNGGHQSAADRRGISLADYIHAMYGFLRQAKSRRVLMIGCGGGTLATMLCRAGVTVTIVDTEARAFTIARRYFHLPEEAECHVADGAQFLRRTQAQYDAIVLDAYDRGNIIPAHFITPAFFARVKARLRPRGGVFLMNLVTADDADEVPLRLMRLMAGTWRQARLLDLAGWENRNAIGLAGAVRDLKRPRLLLKPARRAKTLAAELKAYDFREWRR